MDTNKNKRETDLDASLTEAANGVQTAVDDFNNTNYADFKKGSDYAGLTKQYSNMGKQAMKDTMGQASARTGGYANSYAIHAGQQAQNSFMEKLEDAARGLYDSQRQEKLDKVNVANAIYDRAYGEKQDYIANQQWQQQFEYNSEQDYIAKQNAEKEEYLNNLYTDFSLMSDEEFGAATWDYYRESFENLGLTEEDFNRHKGIVQNDRNVAASGEPMPTISTEDQDYYRNLMENCGSPEEAQALAMQIASSSGNTDYAYDLLYSYYPVLAPGYEPQGIVDYLRTLFGGKSSKEPKEQYENLDIEQAITEMVGESKANKILDNFGDDKDDKLKYIKEYLRINKNGG